jgi:hypothetical protein
MSLAASPLDSLVSPDWTGSRLVSFDLLLHRADRVMPKLQDARPCPASPVRGSVRRVLAFPANCEATGAAGSI